MFLFFAADLVSGCLIQMKVNIWDVGSKRPFDLTDRLEKEIKKNHFFYIKFHRWIQPVTRGMRLWRCFRGGVVTKILQRESGVFQIEFRISRSQTFFSQPIRWQSSWKKKTSVSRLRERAVIPSCLFTVTFHYNMKKERKKKVFSMSGITSRPFTECLLIFNVLWIIVPETWSWDLECRLCLLLLMCSRITVDASSYQCVLLSP